MTVNQGCWHTLIILNIYCFSTATMVTRTRLICTFIHTFLVLFKYTDNMMNNVQCPPRSWKQAFTLFAVLFATFRRGYWSIPQTACSFLCLNSSTLLGSCPHALSTRNPHRNKSGCVSTVWWWRSPKSTPHIAITEDILQEKCRCFRSLRPFACWDCGFESHQGNWPLSVVSVVYCQVEVSAASWSLIQRSHTDCGASLCVI